MAFPQGIYFRSTDNQTDPTNYDMAAVNSFAGTYPQTTAQGNVVGWEAAQGQRNRDTTTDVRLKGINFNSGAGAIDFRIDLPAAGSYNIGGAFGDSAAAPTETIQIVDDTTVLTTVVNAASTGAANHWYDAAGTLRTSEADWVSNNTLVAKTFSTTIFRTRVTGSIANVYIESAGGGGTTVASYLSLMGVG